MKRCSIRILLVTLLLWSFPALSIYKCKNKNGDVSYQDNPCQTSESSETMRLAGKEKSDFSDTLNPIHVKIPNVGDGVLFSYKWWDSKVIQPRVELPPTVQMVSKTGEEPIRFSLSFIPNKSGRKISLEESAETVFQIASQYVDGSVEKAVKLRKLDTTIGSAVYASFTEEKYLKSPVPKGEFSSITVGQVAHSKIVVAFTILTNGTDSKALNEAFNTISSFQIIADK